MEFASCRGMVGTLVRNIEGVWNPLLCCDEEEFIDLKWTMDGEMRDSPTNW
jgi:hypothetical protein